MIMSLCDLCRNHNLAMSGGFEAGSFEEKLSFHSVSIGALVDKARETVLETQWRLRNDTSDTPEIPSIAPGRQEELYSALNEPLSDVEFSFAS